MYLLCVILYCDLNAFHTENCNSLYSELYNIIKNEFSKISAMKTKIVTLQLGCMCAPRDCKRVVSTLERKRGCIEHATGTVVNF